MTPPVNELSGTSFPRERRVLVSADFNRNFADGKRLSCRYFRVHWCPSANEARLGLAVSRKVSKRAVDRNRIKRCARESFRLNRANLPCGDAVLVAFREAVAADSQTLRDELSRIWRKIAALPTSHTQGTIGPLVAGSNQPCESISPAILPSRDVERLPPDAPSTPSA
ncbi:MAG: ribonuclease P protein component [Pseudomarimonas sp.]